MAENERKDSDESRDMVYLAGGAALIVLGAGLILSHPTVRKTVTQGLSAVVPGLQTKFAPNLSALGPDIKRYMRLKSM